MAVPTIDMIHERSMYERNFPEEAKEKIIQLDLQLQIKTLRQLYFRESGKHFFNPF